jgi:hypothetical protein
MAGQGPRAKAAAAAAGKSGKKLLKSEVVAFLDTLGDDELSCASMEEISDDLAELVVNSLSTLLNSGATSHLVKDHEYFWTYDEEEARNVKMANLGILQTRARGTCVARFTYNGVSTRVTLKDCLHAPNAFVNLLSVGRFVTASVSCTFENGGVVLSKVGRSFGYGPMTNRLFDLRIEFLKPPVASQAPAASLVVERPSNVDIALFAKVPESLDLWHYRMGHPGEPAVRLKLCLE